MYLLVCRGLSRLWLPGAHSVAPLWPVGVSASCMFSALRARGPLQRPALCVVTQDSLYLQHIHIPRLTEEYCGSGKSLGGPTKQQSVF